MPYESTPVTRGNSEAKMGEGSHNGTTGIHERDAHVLTHQWSHGGNKVNSLLLNFSQLN